MISLLVHLSAVGVFREMERRATTPVEVELVLPPWKRPTEIIHVVPESPGWSFRNPSKDGTIEVVDETPPTTEVFNPGDLPTVDAEPRGNSGNPLGPDGPPNPSPPVEEAPAFVVVDTPPAPIFAPKPAYPEWAREAGVEGKVLLRVLVGVDGAPKKVTVLSGTTGLTDAAVGTVWKWRFSPGLSNKKAVEVSVEIPFSFRL